MATAVPAIVGVSLVTLAGRVLGSRYTSAFALGIFFWFFIDTIQDSSDLQVNSGFAGGIDQLIVVLLFVIGVLFFFSSDWFAGSTSQPAIRSTLAASTLFIPVVAAIAIGVHGFGEGTAFGSLAAQTSSTSLLDAFGGFSSGVAYVLHKMFESMMVGAIYAQYAKGARESGTRLARNVVLLAILFALPAMIGSVTGYLITYDATYFFALGAGASIFAASKLSYDAFLTPSDSDRTQSLKVALAIVAGFILIYLAALLHS